MVAEPKDPDSKVSGEGSDWWQDPTTIAAELAAQGSGLCHSILAALQELQQPVPAYNTG